MEQQGIDKLRAVLEGTATSTLRAPFDEDAEVVHALVELEYFDPTLMDDSLGGNHQKFRSRVRYLAALWPKATVPMLALRIHGLLNNTNVTVEDIRIILNGQKLSDPSQRTKEISVAIIQAIGKSLAEGTSIRQTASNLRVSVDTVTRIEAYLGINRAVRLRESDTACTAVREGWSVRQLSKKLGVSRSKAQRLIDQGRSILTELGEI